MEARTYEMIHWRLESVDASDEGGLTSVVEVCLRAEGDHARDSQADDDVKVFRQRPLTIQSTGKRPDTQLRRRRRQRERLEKRER